MSLGDKGAVGRLLGTRSQGESTGESHTHKPIPRVLSFPIVPMVSILPTLLVPTTTSVPVPTPSVPTVPTPVSLHPRLTSLGRESGILSRLPDDALASVAAYVTGTSPGIVGCPLFRGLEHL